jgi:hypothetical protein
MPKNTCLNIWPKKILHDASLTGNSPFFIQIFMKPPENTAHPLNGGAETVFSRCIPADR